MTPLLAQAPPDPDLTRPIVVVAVCAAVIIVTVLIQVVQARRGTRVGSPEDLQAWQETSGRLLDQWIDGVEGELRTRRASPFPDTVTPTEDPLGFAEAVATCPDGGLAELLGELRRKAEAMLVAARRGDPDRAEVATAEAAYLRAKKRAGAHLHDALATATPK